MPDSTPPEVPAELVDQIRAGWSLLLGAFDGKVPLEKLAELAIRETLAYAREQAKTIVVINGNEYEVGEWDLRDPRYRAGRRLDVDALRHPRLPGLLRGGLSR